MIRSRNRARGFSGGGYTTPTQLRLITGGQSLIDYIFSRGTPRVAIDFCGRLRTAMGYTQSNSFTIFSGTPNVCTDATTKLGSDYSLKLINCASSGSALVDIFGANEVNPATSSTGLSNYWYNTVDNSAISSDGALDNTPETLAPLGRAMVSAISIYGVDGIIWSQGGTDAGSIIDTTTRAEYKRVLKIIINAMRTAAGNPNLPWFFSHQGRSNTGGDYGFQAVREIQREISVELGNVYLSTEEYYGRLGSGVAYTGATITSGSPTILLSDTTGFAINNGVSDHPSIPDNSYVTAVSAGVSITISKNCTGVGVQTGQTIYRADGIHMYPSSSQPLDTNGNTTHDNTQGFYALYWRAIKNIENYYKNVSRSQKRYGPRITTVTATAGSNEIDAIVSYDECEGSNLTTVNGSISVASAPMFRVENNSSPMTITDIALVDANTLRFTTSSNVSSGTLGLFTTYGAMNKTDYKDFIIDDATPPCPLQANSPTVDANMLISVAATPVSGAIDTVLASAVLQVEATNTTSYGGTGQAWANIIAAPADGSAQSAYDFRLGNSSGSESSDPTFTGTAGNSAAYFALDGGDFFELSGANTTFLNAFHKTTGGTDFTVVLAYNAGSTTGGGLFSTQSSSTNLGFYITSSTTLSASFRGNTNNVITSFGGVSATTDYLLIFSFEASTGTIRKWHNNRTVSTFSTTLDTATADASVNLHLGSRSDGSSFMPAGSKFRGCVVGNAFIDSTKAGQIFDYYNTLHGVTYA